MGSYDVAINIWQALPVLKRRGMERPARRSPLLALELVLANPVRVNGF
jgi:hypothetical protein